MKQEPTFLACGEALMDVFMPDPRVQGATTDARTGGSPFNVAIGLARLSQSVAYLGGISRDAMGERLLRTLELEGVNTTLVERTDAPTTQSLVGVDHEGVPTYEFRGEGGADRQLAPERLAHLPEVRAITVGSYAMVVEPVATSLRALIEQRRSRSFMAWDPNVRPTVVPDAGRWTTLRDWMLPRICLLKASLEDLAFLSPGVSVDECASRALAQGVALVVVTRGDAGATAWTPHARLDVAAVPAVVVDTVGAGDTFQAALLNWLAEHDRLSSERVASMTPPDLDAMMRFAARASAITCSRRGADMPRRHELG